MMAVDYEAQLKELDVKVGRLHTIEDWNRVGMKAEQHPEAITADDLIILGRFAGESRAAQVTERRRLALNPPPVAAPTPPPHIKHQMSRESRIKKEAAYAEVICQVIKSAIQSALHGPLVAERFDAVEQRTSGPSRSFVSSLGT